MLSNCCAKCNQGAVFEYFFFMNENCPQCGHRFEREEGFFVGSMIMAYFAATLLTLPVLLYSIFKQEMELGIALTLGASVMLVTLPIIYRYAKLLWIHLEEKMHVSFQAKRDEAVKVRA